MDARRSSSCGPVIPEDGIFITDKGIGKRSEAFHWLMLGYYVYDHKFHELTVHDLEHNINPNGAMSSMHVRGALWKTVPQRYWLAHRGGRNGLEPAQPGLNMEASGEAHRACKLPSPLTTQLWKTMTLARQEPNREANHLS